KDRDQPVGVRAVGRVRYPSRRRIGPRPVWQQELDHGRIEFGERLKCSYRVVAKVNGAKQPAEQVTEAILNQAVHSCRDRFVATSPAGEPAMPVMRFGRSIHAYPYLDIQLVEESEVILVQADGVGLHSDLDHRSGTNSLP